jgi:hypothetical protein
MAAERLGKNVALELREGRPLVETLALSRSKVATRLADSNDGAAGAV